MPECKKRRTTQTHRKFSKGLSAMASKGSPDTPSREMKYADMERQGSRGTADSVRKLLVAYGDDLSAVQAIQDGINGIGHDKDGDEFEFDKGTVERAQKDAIMADFRTKNGVFADNNGPPPPGTLEQINENLADITRRIRNIEEKLGIAAPQHGKSGPLNL
jgi:hypothetical protein